MPNRPSQTFATHARYLPGWHFFTFPVLGINAIVALVVLVRSPTLASAWAAVVAIALALAIFYSRYMVLVVQDRVIRLEETLRLERLLPERRAEIARLSRNHLVALRFACDAEVPGLMDRILAGEMSSRKDIKRAVTTWRPDYHRA